MAEQYFQNFPKIYYNDKVVRNIILKAKFFQDVIHNYSAFYPYTVKDDDRADTVALHYYGRWEYDWLVYLSNEMVDPYFDWPLDQYNFDRYIVGKYGTYENSLDTVKHYVYNTDVDLKNNTIPEGIRDRYLAEQDYLKSYIMTPDTFANLPVTEKGFWKAVNCYQYEFEGNEKKRNIKLLDNRLLHQVEKEIAEIFRK